MSFDEWDPFKNAIFKSPSLLSFIRLDTGSIGEHPEFRFLEEIFFCLMREAPRLRSN